MEVIVQKVQENIADILKDNPAHFLVGIKVKPTNNIKVYVDGDTGVGIGDLVKYNRALYNKIEEAGYFPEGDFSLEVSSPGLDEPLKLHRQYKKNTGRFVEVVLNDGVKIEGKLSEVSEDGVIIEEIKGKGKKAVTAQHAVLFNDIKTTHIQIKF